MNDTPLLKLIPDDELLGSLNALVQQSRRTESDLVAHIGEVDRRRLYRREAAPSMFEYCTDVLHLSEHETYMRIGVARASRKYPILLTMLRDGRLHLSAIAKLAPHLDGLDLVGRERLLERATHKSKRKIQELVAELAPKPDVPTTIVKLSKRRKLQLGPDLVDAPSQPADPMLPGRSVQATPSSDLVRPVQPAMMQAAAEQPAAVQSAAVESAAVEPLAPERYKVTFTCGSELRDKLDRLRSLMPGCDLAAIIEEAVTEKLERAEARRFGKTKTPRKSLDSTATSPGSRYIPTPVKRIVVERDSGRCTFVNDAGRRCGSRRRLEFHHDQPFGLGGDRSPENIRLLCRSHNGYLAESTYGKERMGQYRRTGALLLDQPETRANVIGSAELDAPRPELSG